MSIEWGNLFSPEGDGEKGANESGSEEGANAEAISGLSEADVWADESMHAGLFSSPGPSELAAIDLVSAKRWGRRREHFPGGVLTMKVHSIVKGAGTAVLRDRQGGSITVSGQWMSALPKVGSVVSVLRCLCCGKRADGAEASLRFVTDTDNYLSVHSSFFSTATQLAESFVCTRRGYLRQSICGASLEKAAPNMILGTIVHELFENAATGKVKTVPAFAKELDESIARNIAAIYSSTATEREIRNGALRHAKNILAFGAACARAEPGKVVVSRRLQIKGKPDLVAWEEGKATQIELKTGKALHTSNLVQAILYRLIKSEGEGGEGNTVLFHLPGNQRHVVELRHSEVRGILIHKNRVALGRGLPPVPENTDVCAMCPLRDACQEIERMGISPGLHAERAELRAHCDGGGAREHGDIELSPIAVEPMDKEARSLSSADGGTKRRKTEASPHALLCALQLDKKDVYRYLWEQIDLEEGREELELVKATVAECKERLLEARKAEERAMQFYVGDHVEMFTEELSSLCKGRVLEETESAIVVEVFEDISFECGARMLFSKGRSTNFYKTLRHNLLMLWGNKAVQGVCMAAPSRGAAAIPPQFLTEFGRLNSAQKAALRAALCPSPLWLIHGMPGAGKTTLIGLLIRILAAKGMKVLVTCFTHLAIQNVESKLGGVKVFRVGKTGIPGHISTVEELREFYDSFSVVMGTCYSFQDPVFIERRFDFCVLDEASQQNVLLAVPPIALSDKIVMVGDHMQLSPLAKAAQGLKVSLFELLYRKGGASSLNTQYRMGRAIMDMSSTLFYGGQMHCAVGCPSSSKWRFIDTGSTEKIEELVRKADPRAVVLCYFNVQVRRVRELRKGGAAVQTVDRFQGSEADSVVLLIDGMVDSPREEILESRERLNVGLTRARKSLLIVGCREKIEVHGPFPDFFRYVSSHHGGSG